MSLNPTSVIGVGRVGLRPNSDKVTNFTLFYFEGYPKGEDYFKCAKT